MYRVGVIRKAWNVAAAARVLMVTCTDIPMEWAITRPTLPSGQSNRSWSKIPSPWGSAAVPTFSTAHSHQ